MILLHLNKKNYGGRTPPINQKHFTMLKIFVSNVILSGENTRRFHICTFNITQKAVSMAKFEFNHTGTELNTPFLFWLVKNFSESPPRTKILRLRRMERGRGGLKEIWRGVYSKKLFSLCTGGYWYIAESPSPKTGDEDQHRLIIRILGGG